MKRRIDKNVKSAGEFSKIPSAIFASGGRLMAGTDRRLIHTILKVMSSSPVLRFMMSIQQLSCLGICPPERRLKSAFLP